jgi:murein DD-endopeptidase MepM/ murein hydrolase activator NlpD
MTPLVTGRLILFAWSWRRPLFLGVASVVVAPLMLGMMLVAREQSQLDLLAGRLTAPVGEATLTQPFGCTPFELEPWSERCPGNHFHSGIDLAAPMKSPVFAATDGTVAAGEDPGGYGLYLIVVRDSTLSTLYGHLNTRLAQAGDTTKAGELIGLMGSSGNSTGPHLHFEVRIRGLPVDPGHLLPSRMWGGGARE